MNLDKLKMLRINSGFSQKELAKEIGLDNTLYNKYENNYNTIPLKHLIVICNYYNVSLDYIFDFTDILKYDKVQKNVDKIIVGKRLKEFRKENNITQLKLAEYLGTSRSVLADYERGRFLISTSFLYMICKKYKVSADYLIGRIDNPKYIK